MRRIIALLPLLAACSGPPSTGPVDALDDAGGPPDLSQAPQPDLGPTADLTQAPDLTRDVDLAWPWQWDLQHPDLQPSPDLMPPADLNQPDLRPTCGLNGLACCPVNVCNDGSFCRAGVCQVDCGIEGKPCCGGPGLDPYAGCSGWPLICATNACAANVGYCIRANKCGTNTLACCDDVGQPGGKNCAGDTHCSLAKCIPC